MFQQTTCLRYQAHHLGIALTSRTKHPYVATIGKRRTKLTDDQRSIAIPPDIILRADKNVQGFIRGRLSQPRLQIIKQISHRSNMFTVQKLRLSK